MFTNNRYLRPPGLIFSGALSSNSTMSSKGSSSSSSGKSLPTAKIHVSPSTSSTNRPDEIVSLVSDEEEQYTTPPSQPSPKNAEDVRFYVESVAEHQLSQQFARQPQQKYSVFSNGSVGSGSSSRKQPTIAAFVAASSRTLVNGNVGGANPPPVTTGNGSVVMGSAGMKPLARSSLPGSIPRGMDASYGASIHAASQQPYPQNPFTFHHDGTIMPQIAASGSAPMYARSSAAANGANFPLAAASNITLGFVDPSSQNGANHQRDAATAFFEPLTRHRGELALHEKYRYDLSRAQLKASSRTSALLAGFAMVALVELQYDRDTPRYLLVLLGVVTTLLVSVHLLALMISTCLLPYIEANGCTQDSPHIRLSKYIELSWLFSTCIGLVLFLLEIGIIFYMKFESVGFELGGYITTAMLVPVLVVFTVLSCLIHRNRFSHSMERVNNKVVDLEKFIDENELHPSETTPPALQSVNVVK